MYTRMEHSGIIRNQSLYTTDSNFFLDICLLWGNFHEEIFKNILRLTRFGVYFERIFNIKWLFSCRNNYINYSCTPIRWGSRVYASSPVKILKTWCILVHLYFYIKNNCYMGTNISRISF